MCGVWTETRGSEDTFGSAYPENPLNSVFRDPFLGQKLHTVGISHTHKQQSMARLSDQCCRPLAHLPMGSSSLARSLRFLFHSSNTHSPLRASAWSPASSKILLPADLSGTFVQIGKKLPLLREIEGLHQAHRLASAGRGRVQSPFHPSPHGVRPPRVGHTLHSPHVVVLAASFQGLTHPFADGHSFLGHGLGVSHIVFHDGLEEFILILPFKGCLWDRGEFGKTGCLTLPNCPKPPGSFPWAPQ